MKFLRTLLVLLGIGIVGAGVLSIVKGVSEGSEGKVNMETMEVVAETPEIEVEMTEMEEVVMEEEMMEETPAPAEPVFMPMTFNKLKELGGTKFKLKGTKYEMFFGKGAKAVKVGDDIYVIKKDKSKWVIHNNKPIKL